MNALWMQTKKLLKAGALALVVAASGVASRRCRRRGKRCAQAVAMRTARISSRNSWSMPSSLLSTPSKCSNTNWADSAVAEHGEKHNDDPAHDVRQRAADRSWHREHHE
jgi:hypothetical protein